jgi:site-specific recombinase XerD
MLSVLIYQGTTTGEVEKIELDDLDMKKATVTIQGGRKGNKRILPLQAAQMGLLIHYLQHTRPQLSEYHTKESNRLFLSLPPLGKKTTAQNELECVFRPIAEQIKSIDKQFLNFKQVRASVITNWLKAQGLRKAQYLAGHRQICCTERYITNDLTGLIDDINTLHPF